MAEAKITISAQDLASAVLDAVNQKIRETGDASQESSQKGSALKQFLSDLVPSGDSANRTFTDLKGTLSDMWENPTGKVKELASAVGEELLPSLGGIAVAGAAAVAILVTLAGVSFELADKAAQAGENVYQAGIKTGMSAEGYSRLSQALSVIGGDVDRVNNAMFMFEKNVGESSPKVADGLGKIGLSLDAINKLEPEQKFLAIADAIARTEDPTLRNAAAAEIFGQRLARDLMPTLIDVGGALEKTAGLSVWTAEQAREAKDFEEDIRLIKLQVAELSLSLGKDLLPAVHDVLTFITEHKADLVDLVVQWNGIKFSTVAEGFRYVGAALSDLGITAAPLPVTMDQVDQQIKKLHASNALAVESTKPLTDGIKDEKLILMDLNETLKEQWKQADEAARAAKAWKAITDELNSAGGDWHATLEGIDGETVNAVEYYLNAGVAQGVLAKAYDLTATQVKAVSDALKDERDWLKEVDREHTETTKLAIQHEKEWRDEQKRLLDASNADTAKSIKDTTTLWEDFYDDIAKQTMTDTEYKKYQINRWFDDEVAKLKDDDAAWGLHYDALYARAQQRMGDIDRATHPFFDDQKQLLSDLDHGWEQTFSTALSKAGSFKDAAVAVYQQLRQEVLKVLGDMLMDFVDHFIKGMLDSWSDGLGQLLAKWVTTQSEMAAVSDAGGAASGTSWWKGFLGGLGGGGGSSVDTSQWDYILRSVLGADPGSGGANTTGDDNGGSRGPGSGHPPISRAVGGIVPGGASGTDTVPAWLTPGEGILTRDTTRRLGGPAAIDHLNSGGSFNDAAIRDLHAEVKGLRSDIARMLDTQPLMLAHALRGAR